MSAALLAAARRVIAKASYFSQDIRDLQTAVDAAEAGPSYREGLADLLLALTQCEPLKHLLCGDVPKRRLADVMADSVILLGLNEPLSRVVPGPLPAQSPVPVDVHADRDGAPVWCPVCESYNCREESRA